jgi:ankyrin repeat protein
MLMYERPSFGVKVLLMAMAYWCAQSLIDMYVNGPSVEQRLMNAVSEDDVAAMDDAVEHGASLSISDMSGRTLLMQAASAGSERVARVLLDRGADPNAVDFNGHTALTFAAQSDCVGMARLLLQQGADPARQDVAGVSPTEAARCFESNHVLALLDGRDPSAAANPGNQNAMRRP